MTKEEAIKQTNEWFMKNANPPQDAIKPITGGRLKGKSDINPQWRIQALTEQYGICGVGWAYEIKEKEYIDVPATGEKMVFITVHLFIRDWNFPDEYKWIGNGIGIGGDFVIRKEKDGYYANDEGLQMALTDAIGKAAKVFGIANNVYRGKFETKYNRHESNGESATDNKASEKQLGLLKSLLTKYKFNAESILKRYNATSLEELTKAQASESINAIKKATGEQ